MNKLPIKPFPSQREWEAWLEANHETSTGIWLKIAKKAIGDRERHASGGAGERPLHGWIDGQRRSLDEKFFLQKFTPRGPRSTWSRVNREKAIEPHRAGRMQPAGLREVERAKADGRWEAAYEPQSTATVPDDLQRELDANPRAERSSLARQQESLRDPLPPPGREEAGDPARRLAQFVAMLEEHRKLYP